MLGETKMSGQVKTKLIKAPKAPLGWRLKNYLRWLFLKAWFAVNIVAPLARLFGIMVTTGKVEARLVKKDGQVIDYGVLGYRVVTNAFVNFLVDNLIAEQTTFGDFKYHEAGTGTTAENATDTDLVTPDGLARDTGTQVEGSANQYQSVVTRSYSSSLAITEHGIFNDPSAGVLMDRTLFAAINVSNGDSIQFTYTLTCNAGS